NYNFKDGLLSFPVIIEGKSRRILVKTLTTDYQLKYLNNKLGSLRITQKSDKWIAQISVNVPTNKSDGTNVMGVDLGLKVPAVAVTESGKTKFFGNGRQNKYIKRKHRAKRKRLGEAKKQQAMNNLNDKEQRWMKDQDHKTSRGIINFAIKNNVSVIRLENLTNIRNTARTSRKNEKNLHTWSFYRLAQFIEYKAKLAGVTVEYVDPKHTSQKCPVCNTLNKAKDRKYQCCCGFKTHRDILGAINIINAPVVDGKSLSA
ncbi:MAG TPA: transposase, partial [Ruminiclostridium sp.]